MGSSLKLGPDTGSSMTSAATRPLVQQTRAFLTHYPDLYRALLADCEFDLRAIALLMKALLSAESRLNSRTQFYLQAVSTRETAFLMTNLPPGEGAEPLEPLEQPEPEVPRVYCTRLGRQWRLGRGRANAIALTSRLVSRHHATIERGRAHAEDANVFYLTDQDSHNGTFVNYRRLHSERLALKNGDLLCFGRQEVQFFVLTSPQSAC
ncbi:FHA domain-containing protein [Leptolyngbya sp. FACHB-261]|uniref:FHA domain-containing protein n=1 Tax=Leptolyngbya sp. FACHB-261 TaxID=2692806 RepID=UPI001687C094|nr:FHA domain-containing protein [Leptolyngbya sp. FACHB-261]MBD2103197.1 FHA domain-containing protein [Leptolyngbya sp. FACHB-261]